MFATAFDGTSLLTATNLGNTLTYQFSTPASTGVEIKLEQTKKEISPSLYIKFVKSKLTKIQMQKLKRRLAKVQKLVAYSKEIGQRALYEGLCEEIAVLVREAEMISFDVDTWINRSDIDKFRLMVRGKVIQFAEVSKFPRVIPPKVAQKFKKLEKAKIFDDFHVLYIDYSGEKLKTNKERIREKDPILFGRFLHQPDRFYYIADWVDEYCDLTLEKFIDKFKETCPDYGVGEVGDITSERWQSIVDEVKARHKRLEDTKIDTWRRLEREEAQAQAAPEPKTATEVQAAAEKSLTEAREHAKAMGEKTLAKRLKKAFRKIASWGEVSSK